MNIFDIPVSAIRSAQQGMYTVSSNLANASTPGYHLQRAQLSESLPTIDGNLRVGAGVQVDSIERLRSAWLEQSLLRNSSSAGAVSSRLEASQQLDSLFNPTDSSIHARVQKFFESWQDLGSLPADSTLRRDLLASADGLVSEINSLHDSLSNLARDFDAQISATVRQINQYSTDIASLNREVQIAESSGTNAHDLTDRRDQLVTKLSELLDVHSLEGNGQANVFSAANGAMIIGTHGPQVSLDASSGQYRLVIDGWTSPLPAGGGRLAGLLEARDSIIADARNELDRWSASLIRTIDQLHAQGLGLDGPFSVLSGDRGLTDATSPVATASQLFPVNSGKLTITVTNAATGQRTVSTLAIEPGLDSLNDIAAKISAVPHLSAEVSADSGRLTIVAEQGYGFDFTGRTATEPDTTGWTGSSAIKIGGSYTGTKNTDWTVSVVGSGTIGVTPDLRAEVHDAAGNLMGAWNIGLGYVAGDPLTTSQGLSLQFSSGTVIGAQAAKFRVTANSDETGILSALGLNSMFSGVRAGDFSVRSELLTHPDQIAAARSDQPGDNANAKLATALASQRLAINGGLTFAEVLGQMTADAGSLVQDAQTASDQLTQMHIDLQAQQQSLSGVDPNEELVKMLEYQRLFQSAARFITTANSVLDELFNMMR